MVAMEINFSSAVVKGMHQLVRDQVFKLLAALTPGKVVKGLRADNDAFRLADVGGSYVSRPIASESFYCYSAAVIVQSSGQKVNER